MGCSLNRRVEAITSLGPNQALDRIRTGMERQRFGRGQIFTVMGYGQRVEAGACQTTDPREKDTHAVTPIGWQIDE